MELNTLGEIRGKKGSCQKFFPDHWFLLKLINLRHVGREIVCLMASRRVGQLPTVPLPRLRKLTPPDRIPLHYPDHTRNVSLNLYLPHIYHLNIRNDIFSLMSLYQNSVLVAKDIKTNSNWFKPKGVKKKNLLAHKIETFRSSAKLIQPGSRGSKNTFRIPFFSISSASHFVVQVLCPGNCRLTSLLLTISNPGRKICSWCFPLKSWFPSDWRNLSDSATSEPITSQGDSVQ